MTEEDDPFESPRLLLENATRHRDAFMAQLTALRATDWSEPINQGDGQFVVRSKARVPSTMKTTAFDLTNSLRSALDHAVFASALALTGEERDGTKFPFGDTAEELDGDAKRRCKHVPRELVDFILAFEAHRDGNPLLWGLNKLRNTKSHRVLIPFASATAQVGQGEPSAGTTVTSEWDQATSRLKVRFDRSPGTPLGAVIFAFRLEVLIGTGKFSGEPALSVFDSLLGEVQRVVSSIEAETARIIRERGF